MRILQIRFRNLNSLVGEWQIDLTDPAYVSDGIFAITGPTGAGKSTILDAICLALYGCTPRLGRVTAGGNEIMSRQTGDCFAEVTFETAAGRFRCHWSQHRARRKAEGDLQQPRQEIASADTGEIIESQIRRVAGQVESVTGMDFERFTRSMLLAQGGFAAFLQADADRRAPILEQITGTEIYSDISVRVHERQRAEKQQLELLQAETAGLVLLDAEQEQQIGQQLQTRVAEQAELETGLTAIREAVNWLTTLDSLNREWLALDVEAERLMAEVAAFEPVRSRLDRALRAATLEGGHAALSATRRQLQQDRSALETQLQALPALEAAAQQQAEQLQAAEQACINSRQQQTEAAPLLQQVRSVDQTLAELQRRISAERQVCDKESAAVDALRDQRAAEQKKHEQAGAQARRVEDYLQQHARDEWLVSGLAGVSEQLHGLLDRQQQISQVQRERTAADTAVRHASAALTALRKQYSEQKRALEAAAERKRQGQMALAGLLDGRLLREYRAEKDALLREAALLSRIAELEEQRQRLADGEPCPLCGATEHPFAHGNVPTPDATEQRIRNLDRLITRAEEQEAVIRDLEQAELQANTAFTSIEAAGRTANHELQSAETRLAEIDTRLQAMHAEFASRREAVAARLLPLGITDIPEQAIVPLLDSLDARRVAWQEHERSKLDVERQQAHLASEMRRLDALIESAEAALTARREALAGLEKEQTGLAAQRRELFGDRDPGAEERRLQQRADAAAAAEHQARTRHTELHGQWHSARVQVESLQQRIARCEPELAQQQAAFQGQLAEAGFADEPDYLQALLSPAERSGLAAQARALEQRQTELDVRRRECQQRLATERARKLTEEDLEQLQPRLVAGEQALGEVRDICAGLRHRLQENAAARERLKEQQQAIEAQQRECRRWDALHALIGSADGKKYRNFAQGLTFEMMIGHANRQLQKMSDRYLLVRDGAQPLELNVMDNYQAGEVRSTRNLSGGESFIVSLALALGLSQMSSCNVRVDSLFLDEGFGTLDEEALDIALDTLSGLQQDGKLIGVISHVQALKERIATRIVVQPVTGGRSRISGPGCAAVSV